MSIATHLVTVARSLSDILNDINIELVNKGSTSADTLDQVDEKIRAITGGGSTQDADAVAGDIRAGKTAYARGSKIVGTLASVNPGVPTISVSSSGTVTASVTQSAGIVNAATTPSTHKLSSADDSAFVKENIKAGVTIFGVSGNYSGSGTDTQDANAVAGDIRTGKTAYVKGVKVTGTLLEKTAQTYTPGTASQTIPANRITTGVQTIKGDSNLVASNIKNGISIFGVTGNYSGSGSDTSDATASASDIRSGKTAYISTGKTTGTMSTVTAPNPSISVSSSGVITASYSMSSGYTSGGNKSATKTLSSADDPAFIRENIKAGATIFGLDGNYSGVGSIKLSYNQISGTTSGSIGGTLNIYDNASSISGNYVSIAKGATICGFTLGVDNPIFVNGYEYQDIEIYWNPTNDVWDALGTYYSAADSRIYRSGPYRNIPISIVRNSSLSTSTVDVYSIKINMGSSDWSFSSTQSYSGVCTWAYIS